MARLVISAALIGAVLWPSNAFADEASFDNGFAVLNQHLDGKMGNPLVGEHPDPNGTDDIVQETTTGLARYHTGSMPAFFDGTTRWTWTPDYGVVEWQGDDWTLPEQRIASVSTVWDSIKNCETPSNGWNANTGNGYFGGLQEDITFWRNYGGPAFASRPDLASREQQIIVAERGLAAQGWGAWPVCSRRLGLR